MTRSRRFWFFLFPALGFLALGAHFLADRLTREPPNYDEIEPGLFLGGSVAVPPPGTGAVLNLCEIEDPYQAPVHEWHPIRDAAPAPSLDWLRERVAFIDAQRRAGKIVYVHCRNGVSRSGVVVVAYFMWREGWSLAEATRFVRSKREGLRPNPAFVEMLAEWEVGNRESGIGIERGRIRPRTDKPIPDSRFPIPDSRFPMPDWPTTIYDELRKLAAARLVGDAAGLSLDATGLVHEVYLRLAGESEFRDRSHFFAIAARAMRRVLVDRARARKTQKRDGGERVPLEDVGSAMPDEDLLALDESLERFAAVDPLKARLVELRFFSGLTADEAARTLDISPTTADRYWAYARAWLQTDLGR